MTTNNDLHPLAATRYAAYDFPGVWHEESWEQEAYGKRPGGTGRVAHYSLDLNNRHFPGILDGIRAEIVVFPDVAEGKPLLSCQATRPDKTRTQLVKTRRYKTWAGAKRAATAWLKKAHEFVEVD